MKGAAVFLRAIPGSEQGPILRGSRVWLRPPALADYPAWAALRAESRAFLVPWEPLWPSDDLSRAAFRRRLRRYARDSREDTGHPFFVFRKDDDALVGGLSFAYVRRGVTQAASLGYWIGERYARRGLMSDAVRTALQHAFGGLRLHRVEAACLPHNEASIRLLEKVGFQREGYARRYLCINGAWQDHVLFAVLADDRLPEPRAAEAREPARTN